MFSSLGLFQGQENYCMLATLLLESREQSPHSAPEWERKICNWMPPLGWEVPNIKEEKRDWVMLPTFEYNESLFVSPLELEEVGCRRKVGEKE